ncbi:MAG: Acetyltransferase [Candidatus Tokpelaia sp. JSC085]|nr:MAG: Acetyltransferase [Candidatus Tokpelaia sp. JSC085]
MLCKIDGNEPTKARLLLRLPSSGLFSMIYTDIIYTHERSVHDLDIETLNATAFGPARYTRAVHFVRQSGPHDLSLSFIASAKPNVVGSVRMTQIAIGLAKALLLGPIVVRSDYKNAGIGSTLMNMTLTAARYAGHQLVILVGDKSYYHRFNFQRVPERKIIMPAPVNPNRLLAHELVEGALLQATGIVRHINCVR